jgi:hypothetical protein
VARGRPLRCGVSAGRQCRFVWLGVFGATSRAVVLLSIEPVVASGEWSSPVDQDHPGDLWPGSWAAVFFGVTPAAGPGVVVAAISRALDNCVTGLRRRDETFGRLNPQRSWPEAATWRGLFRGLQDVLKDVASDRPICRFLGEVGYVGTTPAVLAVHEPQARLAPIRTRGHPRRSASADQSRGCSFFASGINSAERRCGSSVSYP